MSVAEKFEIIADEVYNKGYEKGKADGGDSNAFWDSYLDNGNLKICDYLFAGKGWNNTTFKPKHSITPTRSTGMFNFTAIQGNLAEMLANLGITIDFSNCTLFGSMFTNAFGITETPPIDLSKATTTSSMFVNADIKIIGTLTCSEGTVLATNMFDNLTLLENITFAGVIPSSIAFAKSSKLTYNSIMSIANALKDYSGTTTKPTLTLHANAKARLSESDIATITEKGWTLA